MARMGTLKTVKSGSFQARKIIPADCRAEYAKLFGQGRELKLTLPAGTPPHEAKARAREWLSEVENRIQAIRAGHRGQGRDLDAVEAAALAGQWYDWFLAPHARNPGDPELWARGLDMSVEEGADIEFLAVGARFLASQGISLAPAANDRFLMAVGALLPDALDLLRRQALGDHSPDPLPQTFPKAGQKTTVNPWALFEAWVARIDSAELAAPNCTIPPASPHTPHTNITDRVFTQPGPKADLNAHAISSGNNR